MNNARIISLFLFLLFAPFVSAQEREHLDKELDSLNTDLRKKGIVVTDSTFKKERALSPLAPSRAAFYSAVLPGLGQVYNRRYWKVPLVYAAIGTGVYGYLYNDDLYDRFRTAFKRRRAGFTDDEFWDLRTPGDGNIPDTPDLDDQDLQSQQERYQRDRDLFLIVTIALYALNIVDANVDAHLKQFNVDEDLAFDLEPKVNLDPISNQPNYCMAFTLKF